MSVALRGNVKDFGIAEVFQLVGQQRKTGILEFSGSSQQIQLVFDRGAVVSAAPVGDRPYEALGDMLVRCGLLPRDHVDALLRECAPSAQTLARLAVDRGGLSRNEVESIEDLLTRETVFRVLRWESGFFDFIAQEVDHHRAFETLLGAEQILMDGLRMVDEWQSFAELVPSEGLVFQKTGRFEQYSEGAEPHQLAAAERVFQLVDGRLSVRRIIDLSLLGTFDATRALAEMRRAGIVEPLDAEGARRAARGTRRKAGPVPRSGQMRGAVTGILALGLLCAVVFAARHPVSTPSSAAGAAIERDALAAAREAHDARRLRHALDVFRFVHGRWPQDLAELESRPLLGPRSLASVEGRPYYYRNRDGNALLLAPER
jgi:hypothetical protein